MPQGQGYAGVPEGPLSAYLGVRDANQQAGFRDLQGMVSLQGLQEKMQDRQRLEKFQAEIASADTPEKKIAVAAKYGAPKDVLHFIGQQEVAKEAAKERASNHRALEKIAGGNLEERRRAGNFNYGPPPSSVGLGSTPTPSFGLGSAAPSAPSLSSQGGLPQMQIPPAVQAGRNLEATNIQADLTPNGSGPAIPSATVLPRPATAIPTMPPEIARLSPRGQQQWLLQQTRPSIAGNAPISPETATRIAQQVLSGDISGTAGWSRNQTTKAQIENEVTRLLAEQGKVGGDIVGAKAMTAANRVALTESTKNLIAIVPFKEMLDQNIDIAKDLGRKIAGDKTNSTYVNRPLVWLKNNLSDRPDIATYLAQMHFVEVEAARVLTQPRLVGQLTDQAISDLKSVVNGNMTIASTEAVLDRIKGDGQIRIDRMLKTQARVLAEIKGVPARTRGSDKPKAEDFFK